VDDERDTDSYSTAKESIVRFDVTKSWTPQVLENTVFNKSEKAPPLQLSGVQSARTVFPALRMG
jgi:hypothetical protein